MITRSCDCEPIDTFGDGDVPEHAEECPRRHSHIHTAEDVSRAPVPDALG